MILGVEWFGESGKLYLWHYKKLRTRDKKYTLSTTSFFGNANHFRSSDVDKVVQRLRKILKEAR